MAITIGELTGIEDGIKIEWKISDFFIFLRDENAQYYSPTFTFAGASWYLRMDLKSTAGNTAENIHIYLMKNDSSHSVTLSYELGLKNLDGSIDKDCSYTNTFKEKEGGRGCSNFITKSQLFARKSDLAPSNVITVICKLTQNTPNVVLSPPFQRAEKLSKDLKELMINGIGSDLTVRVKEKEFKLHKNILRVRSPAFATMVKTEMDNSKVDIVEILDCEEYVFSNFFEYVYTGTVTDLTETKFYDLYEIAEKYKVEELKDDCLKRIKDTLSIDTFFDAVQLAEKYDEKELQLLTSKFCSDNLKVLFKSSKWMTFMEENSKKAYELLSAALSNYVKA